MMIPPKIIIAILLVVTVIAVGVTVVVKVVSDDNKADAAVRSTAPDGGRGQPHGEVKNSPSKEY